jgi:hypothetical protein
MDRATIVERVMQIVQNVEAMLAMSQAHTTQRQKVEKGSVVMDPTQLIAAALATAPMICVVQALHIAQIVEASSAS